MLTFNFFTIYTEMKYIFAYVFVHIHKHIYRINA